MATTIATTKNSETAPVITARILRRLLAGGGDTRVERMLEKIHPADLGPLLADLTPDEIRTVIDLLFKQHRAAAMLKELPPEMLPEVFETVSDQRLVELLERVELDDMLELIEGIPKDRLEAVRSLLPDVTLEELRKAEIYPPSSAGRAMTTTYMALDEKMTAQEAIDSIRASGELGESVLYLYVIDEERRLRGVVPIRRLVTSPPERPCGEMMIREAISTPPEADQEEVARLVARYDLLAIPVTDVDGTLLGVITVDDVIDVITEEATEDMYHLAGLSEEDRVFTKPSHSVRKRLPWMLVNLGTAFAAAWVVGLFQQTIENLVALAVLLPVVAGMGGNGGIQTLTVITRAIALGEIEFSSGVRAVGKEFLVGLVLGAVTGAASAAIITVWQGNPVLGLVIFIAMVSTMAVAGLLGASVPLALKAMGLDPALGAGVVVTFFTDAFGFFSFLGIATLLMEHLL
ncbi:MAG: magnesium transporter [Deltaproteobacteria bacterium]|nr:magnesium transporter [Deltaproteobacteria bacterium]MBW2724789.1 magnesium transporter [Deltaproteobacteria bacterium]